METRQRILVTGSTGQIGSELTLALRQQFGDDRVVAGGHTTKPSLAISETGPFVTVDVTNSSELARACEEYEIDTIVNLAALLSAEGESNPQLAWQVNVNGLLNCLEIARTTDVSQVISPSSIAVFGPGSPKENTPQETVLRPTTMYGITKVTGELLCDYYFHKYGVDARGLRFPGIISADALPGGGTTDYAVEMFYKAIEGDRYTCFVSEQTILPMMFMPDCLKAIIDLMEADAANLSRRGDYNVGSMSFTAGELAEAIRRHIPDFDIAYEPDERQAIADSWPRSLDDSVARADWNWQPAYDLETMTEAMLTILANRHAEGNLYL